MTMKPARNRVSVLLLALLLMFGVPMPAAAAGQPFYATPEAAVSAFRAALKSGKASQIIPIFGKENKDLVVTGDTRIDADTYADIVEKMDTFILLDPVAEDRRVLQFGEDAWPFPIPIVKEAAGWRFASEQGREELLHRRIGGNELYAISVMKAFTDAQHLYSAADRNGDGVREFAQRLASTPGNRDGLYWDADPAKGEEMSPWGPLIAATSLDTKEHREGDGYRGYRYRILTRQGPAADGGAFDYIVNGRMLAGYALVAYPAEYDASGIMTFIVNRNGKVFQRDLGPDGAVTVATMTAFDPGPEWTPVTP